MNLGDVIGLRRFGRHVHEWHGQRVDGTFADVRAEAVRALLSADPRLRYALEAVAALDLPDAWIGAGFVRNACWDAAHGRGIEMPRDIDVVYFDREDPFGVREPEHAAALAKRAPTYPWEVRNQARMHRLHGHAPYGSTVEAVSHWVETATAVAARIGPDGGVQILAPYGTDDLLDMIVRPVPSHRGDLSTFMHRLATKGWLKRWPQLRIREK